MSRIFNFIVVKAERFLDACRNPEIQFTEDVEEHFRHHVGYIIDEKASKLPTDVLKDLYVTSIKARDLDVATNRTRYSLSMAALGATFTGMEKHGEYAGDCSWSGGGWSEYWRACEEAGFPGVFMSEEMLDGRDYDVDMGLGLIRPADFDRVLEVMEKAEGVTGPDDAEYEESMSIEFRKAMDLARERGLGEDVIISWS